MPNGLIGTPVLLPSFATPKRSLQPWVLANALTLLSQLVGSLRSSISFLSYAVASPM